jgi:hypothetical protein
MGLDIPTNLDEIKKFLQEQLTVKTEKKQEHGEVFTPIEMIELLLDHFPSSIWKNKTITWLDPANGIGNFPICIFFRYMKGLEHVITNPTKRAEHIITNMLYMAEITSENVKLSKKLFKSLCPTAEPNLLEGDFLAHVKDEKIIYSSWPTQFDCIVGNPPYNAGGTKRVGEKRLHIAFTEACLQILTKKGSLAFICPPNYREADSRMNKLFQIPGHFSFIKMYSPDETLKLFRVQGRVDSFLFQKDTTGLTTIIDEYSTESKEIIDLTQHIPNFGFSIFTKLLKKVKSLGSIEGFRNTELTTVKESTFGCGSHKLLHLIVADGRRIYKTERKHSLEKTPKVLINGLGLPYVFYDKDGKYAPSQTPIIVLNPNTNTVKFLESPYFQFIAWGLRITGNNNMPYILDFIPKFNSSPIVSFKSFFGFTEKEEKFIQSDFLPPVSKDKDIVQPCTRKTRKIKKNKTGTRKQK